MARIVAGSGGERTSVRTARVRTVARVDAWTGAAVLMSGLACAWFVNVALTRWQRFETNAYDLAFFDQIIWNTSRGRWLETSFVPYNFLGQHVEPVLLPFALVYRLLDAGPLLLTTTQSIVAAVAALPLFAAARRFGLAGPAALVVTSAYLLNPYLHRAVEFDFHPEVMVALPAFASAWAVAAGRYWLAVGLALCTLLYKEDAAFVALALAGLLWVCGARRPAAVTAGVAVAWAVAAVLVVMPLARGGMESDLVARYGHLVGAGTQAEVVTGLVARPWAVPQHLLEPRALWTMALFVGISAPVAALRPVLLAPLVPGLALAVLSGHRAQAALEFHYAAGLVPVAALATLVAARDLRPRLPQWALASLVALPVVAGFLAISPLSPLQAGGSPPTDEHRAALAAAVTSIPDGTSVSAQSHVLPRLSQRQDAFEFPFRWEDAEWVLIDRYGHRSGASLDAGFDRELERVRASYQRVLDRDGVELFRRPQ